MVEAYGTSTALDNLAQVSAKDGRNLLVNVYDEHTTTAIEKAIRGAGLNLNPVKEGQTKLRVPIPKQTEKAKESMAKVSRHYLHFSELLKASQHSNNASTFVIFALISM